VFAEYRNYSDYVIYVDESGDHGLSSINPEHPVFVLVFCIFEKKEYIEKSNPLVQKLKFQYFGHDSVILHASDIRKSRGDFSFLYDQKVREQFLLSVSEMMSKVRFSLVATVVDKRLLKERHIEHENPYEIALRSCMEQAYDFLAERKQHGKITHIVIEKRGKQEDSSLELAFRRIVQGDNSRSEMTLFGLDCLPFEMVFADKKINSNGLQIADLSVHPIAKKSLKPQQNNKAYDIISGKFYNGEENIKKHP
jgi:hypothetical protein